MTINWTSKRCDKEISENKLEKLTGAVRSMIRKADAGEEVAVASKTDEDIQASMSFIIQELVESDERLHLTADPAAHDKITTEWTTKLSDLKYEIPNRKKHEIIIERSKNRPAIEVTVMTKAGATVQIKIG